MTEYVYAVNEDCENWMYESIDEAIEELAENDTSIKVGDKVEVYRGEKQAVKLSEYVHCVADDIESLAYDDLGEVLSEPLFDKDARVLFDNALKGFVDAYAEKEGLQPSCYKVVNIKPQKAKITKIAELSVSFINVSN